MTKSDAIQRINEGLGFRTLGADLITRRLVEAQRDLERGKTLPFFLVEEDFDVVLIQGTREIALPDGFIREYDDGATWVPKFARSESLASLVPIRKVDLNSLMILDIPTTPGSPLYYVIRSQSLWFGRYADVTYTFDYSFYKHADDLTSNEENAWTLDPSGYEWLVGRAGAKMAADLRDQAAVALFTAMAAEGRAALLGEIIAQDDVVQYVGSNN